MIKKALVLILKISITGLLIYWLLKSGKLDLKLIKRLFDHPLILVLCFILMTINLIFTAFRWRFILEARSKFQFRIPFITAVNWIGMFFSSVLPGSITGDFVKLFYIQKWDKKLSKQFLLFTILADRLMGLIGLIMIMGFCSIINYSFFSHLSSQISHILLFNFYIFLILIVSLFIFYFYPRLIESFLRGKLLELWKDLVETKKSLIKAILLSILIQFIGITIFYLLSFPYFESSLKLFDIISFVPIGFIAVAIPLAPGGLGVGHVAFERLFAMVGETQGANFFNSYFIISICFNLVGIIPYFLLKRTTRTN
jgi:uncharacterized membrane protein YbhN (UPF0104 family)